MGRADQEEEENRGSRLLSRERQNSAVCKRPAVFTGNYQDKGRIFISGREIDELIQQTHNIWNTEQWAQAANDKKK